MERIRRLAAMIRDLDAASMAKAQERLDSLTKPAGSLGKLEELAIQVCGVTGKEEPLLQDKVIFTLASDHGVTEEGVSAYPREVTAQMVSNFLCGKAGINVLASHVGARVRVVDMGVASNIAPDERLTVRKINYGTKNMSKGPAMSREEAVRSISAGMEVFEDELKKGVDIAGTGDMGIGNTTPSSAMAASFIGLPVECVTGRGAGLDDAGLKGKVEVIKRSIAVNRPDPADPIDVLSKVGGFEIGGLAGIILAAAANRVPVVIDGFISGAAALLAYRIEPRVRDYMIASHESVERGHRAMLEHMGLKPLLDLDLRLGEGTGAALGIWLSEAAVKLFTRMATFKSAGVSERKK